MTSSRARPPGPPSWPPATDGPDRVPTIERLVGQVTGGLAFLGGLAVLLCMALLTCADVVLRAFGSGIPGSWEMVTLSMRWMIGLALPYAFWTGRHVAVEAFTEFLPDRARLAFILLGEVLALAAMSLLAWRLHVRGMQILGQGSRTSDLGILTFYNWLPLILGASISVLVLAVMVLRDGGRLVAPRPARGARG